MGEGGRLRGCGAPSLRLHDWQTRAPCATAWRHASGLYTLLWFCIFPETNPESTAGLRARARPCASARVGMHVRTHAGTRACPRARARTHACRESGPPAARRLVAANIATGGASDVHLDPCICLAICPSVQPTIHGHTKNITQRNVYYILYQYIYVDHDII